MRLQLAVSGSEERRLIIELQPRFTNSNDVLWVGGPSVTSTQQLENDTQLPSVFPQNGLLYLSQCHQTSPLFSLFDWGTPSSRKKHTMHFTWSSVLYTLSFHFILGTFEYSWPKLWSPPLYERFFFIIFYRQSSLCFRTSGTHTNIFYVISS